MCVCVYECDFWINLFIYLFLKKIRTNQIYSVGTIKSVTITENSDECVLHFDNGDSGKTGLISRSIPNNDDEFKTICGRWMEQQKSSHIHGILTNSITLKHQIITLADNMNLLESLKISKRKSPGKKSLEHSQVWWN